MGISDDIKPRKVYNYSQKKNPSSSEKDSFEVKISKSLPEKQDNTYTSTQQEVDDYLSGNESVYENKNELENDFFENEAPVNKHEKKNKKKRFKFPTKLVTWIIVLFLLGLAVYKNLDKIVDLIIGQTTSTELASKDESYVSTDSKEQAGTAADTTTTGTGNTTTPATTPTVSTTTQSKSSIKIEVLNGNGVSGSADKVRDQLVSAGFTVSKVANAKKFTYASTYIYYKTGATSSMELVKAALSTRTCIAELSDSLSAGYDVVVVVGKK